MGKPIGYNPARLQRAYLPMPGIELFDNRTLQKKIQKKYKKINIVILILHCKALYYHNGASGIQSE